MSQTQVFFHVHADFGFAFFVTNEFLKQTGDVQAAGSSMTL